MTINATYWTNDSVKIALYAAGFVIERLATLNHGTQFLIAGGVKVNVYHTGKVLVQGKKYNDDVARVKKLFDKAELHQENENIKNSLDQQTPTKGFGDMWKRVIKKFSNVDYYDNNTLIDLFDERRNIGYQKYGNYLQAYNNRNALEDLISKMSDSLAYMEQISIESPALNEKMTEMQKQIFDNLNILTAITPNALFE